MSKPRRQPSASATDTPLEAGERIEDANSRTTAARLIYLHRQHGGIPSRRLEGLTRDRAFVTELVLGVIRNERALEWIIAQLATKAPSDKLVPVLMVGLYQLLFLDHVEPYAAIHETVESSKTLCGESKSGFVNAILRRALREATELRARLQKQSVAIRYSHPDQLVDRWTKEFGAKDAAALCEWNNERPTITLRTRSATQVDVLVHDLQAAGIPAKASAYAGFIDLGSFTRITELPGYNEGTFTVQDPATLLAVDLLAPASDESILDVCAAPGGKAIAIADLLGLSGKLIAADINPKRLERLKDNLARCRCEHVEVRCLDATTFQPDDFGDMRFDAILLDVPCSNTGVIRRRPEARRQLTRAQLQQLLELQATLIDRSVPLLAKGGRIVYSTCSLEMEENEHQMAQAMERHPGLKLIKEDRRFPPRDQCDGAYAAVLKF